MTKFYQRKKLKNSQMVESPVVLSLSTVMIVIRDPVNTNYFSKLISH